MKLAGVLILLLITSQIKTIAQEFNAGVYAGLVASQIDGDTYDGYNKAGLISGAYINRFATKKLAWQMGLRYAQKGSNQSDSKKGPIYTCRLQYMELPLTLRYQQFKKLDFEAGLSMGYLIKAMESIGGSEFVEPTNPDYYKFEWAALFGINYHFNKKFEAGAHFSYSILNVRPFIDSPSTNSPMDYGQHNNLLYFTLGYKLSSWR